jgi:glycosyltransferase involved in cell wall biosynthesis
MKNVLIRVTTVSISLDKLLAGQLKYLNQHFDIVGLSSGKEALRKVAEREGIRTIEIDMKREIDLFSDLNSLIRMIKVIRLENPYIVHANTPKGSLLSMLASWINHVPHRIYTVTGLRFETSRGLNRFLLKSMERITCLCATKVIPEGDGVKNTLIKERITKKPLRKILNGNINGIDMTYFSSTVKVLEVADKIRDNNAIFTFCFVGRLVKDKGINELIEAFVKLRDEFVDIHLLLVGNFEKDLDPLSDGVVKLILNSKGIRFMDYQEDVRPFFAASDALVFPSYREGFPNVVLQAGAMGLPSIVTDINGCNEIIIQGQNGIIIPPRNADLLYGAMKYFIEQKDDLVKEMSVNARSMIASRYEQSEVWKALLEEYQGLI